MKPRHTSAFALALVLAGCGSGSGPAAPGIADVPPATSRVTGRATKGPLSSAEVALYGIDGRGNPVGAAIARTSTDEDGNWSVSLPADHPDYLVVVTGGRFVDESDTRVDGPRSIQLGDDDSLLSVLPAGAQSAAVTLFTHALVEKSRRESRDDDFLDLLDLNKAQYSSTLGVDPLLTRSADPLAPTGSADEQRYAMIVGGAAYALNALAIERGLAAANYATIELFARDLVDCRFDGRGVGGQPLYDYQPFGGRTLDDEILRFRNNNIDAYRDVEIPRLGGAACPATPGSEDTVAPVFTATAATLQVGADSAAGVSASAAPIVAALAAFGASDDRDPAPRIEALLPDPVPLGSNAITVVALDAWGNRAEAVWTIDVADLEPPTLLAPPAVTVAATGPLTSVSLGAPVVSDNVSTEAGLVVGNDAPAEGFAPGAYAVTWTARDEAGLTASAVQQVVVADGAPLLAAPLPPLVATEGTPVSAELDDFFSDPVQAPLSYSVSGLPAGTGLSVDSSGRVGGVPGLADLAAQPLALRVTASNGPFSIAADWRVLIQPAVPAFQLSQTALSLDEDFVEVVTLDAVPTSAPVAGGSVSYSVVQTAGEAGLLQADVDPLSGRIALTAGADRFGEGRWTVTAANSQNGARFDATFVVDVVPRNDAPRALADGDEIAATADRPFELSLAARFVDVDGDALSYAVAQVPDGYAVDGDRLSGVADELAAAGGVYRARLTATDGAGLSATSRVDIRVTVVDTDGDGLSDRREGLLGTDADAPDSDGDGVDDGAEVLAGADPLAPATAVVFLSTGGSNGNGGTSFADALRDHDGIGALPAGESPARPTFVVYAADRVLAYDGALVLTPPCDNVVLLGSVDAASGVSRSGPASSRLTAGSVAPVTVGACDNVRLVRLAVVDNKTNGVRVAGGSVELRDVYVRNNFAELPGAGIAVQSGSVVIDGGAIAANESRQGGAGVYVAGAGAQVALRDVTLSGNYAVGAGGAVLVDAPGAVVDLFNVLMTANSAARGGALHVRSGVANVASSTLAFNQRWAAGDGAAIDVEPATGSVALRDSLVWFNRDNSLAPSALAAGVASDFNTLEQAPVGPNDSTFHAAGAAFGQGYAVTEQTGAIDLGSAAAADVGLDAWFSVSGSPYADDGVLDRGRHTATGATDALLIADGFDALLRVDRAPTTAFAAYRRLTLTPTVGGEPLGTGRRVRVSALGNRSILAAPVSLFGPDEEVLATDLGNGDYMVWLDARDTDHDVFRVTVDGVSATVSRARRCLASGCSSARGELNEATPLPED